ncbi:MAG: TonB-dependent receptor, partial [Cyclobacteriaceae bacterium]
APQGLKFNPDWGVLNGETVNVEDNFYHKPQFALNHYWTIDSKSELSTAAYMSFGTGGGGGTFGDFSPAGNPGPANGYQPYDLDALVDANQATTDGNALSFLRASRNDHEWYGVLSTYNRQVNSNLNVLAGIDLRQYIGRHFREITNLLGADYYLSNDDINNPNDVIGVGDKYSYNNDGLVRWYGGFLQGEYTKGKLSAFANLSVSSTGYKRIDYFSYLESDPLYETDYNYFTGFQIKGGANYNLTQNHNVFANVGYFTKAPDFDAAYPGNDQIFNTAAENQKIMSFEVGYGYRSTTFNANVNLYNTAWLDRTQTQVFNAEDDDATPEDESEIDYFASLLGVDALHQGIEIDFIYKPTPAFTLTGMASIGNWKWTSDVDSAQVFDEDQNVVGTFPKLYIEGLKVGDAAQTTFALGASYEFFSGFKLGANMNYFDRIFAEYDPSGRSSEALAGVRPIRLPNYTTVDLSMKYEFDLGANKATLYGNVNNLFNEEYIAESTDAQDANNRPDISQSLVYYGIGRTWTLGMKYTF